jgi:hypothetical protein
MILITHILVGAAIGILIPNYWPVFIIAFASHFLLDAIPHWEYKIQLLRDRAEKRKGVLNIINVIRGGGALVILGKMALDFSLGLSLVALSTRSSSVQNHAIFGALSATLPDAFLGLYWITKTPLLEKLARFHRFVHPKNNKKIPTLWGVSTQIVIGAIAIVLILHYR